MWRRRPRCGSPGRPPAHVAAPRSPAPRRFVWRHRLVGLSRAARGGHAVQSVVRVRAEAAGEPVPRPPAPTRGARLQLCAGPGEPADRPLASPTPGGVLATPLPAHSTPEASRRVFTRPSVPAAKRESAALAPPAGTRAPALTGKCDARGFWWRPGTRPGPVCAPSTPPSPTSPRKGGGRGAQDLKGACSLVSG